LRTISDRQFCSIRSS